MITPEKLAASGSEHGHQAAFFQWVALNFQHESKKLLFAVPNGGDRNIAVAANMKAEGVKSGVPDVFWPVPIGQFAGLWLELKRPGLHGRALGGRSENQEKWHKDLVAQRYAVATVYGWEAMVQTLLWYSQLGRNEFAYYWSMRKEANDCLFVVGTAIEGFKAW